MLGGGSPDISKISNIPTAVYFRIWEIGDWHDSLYEITSFNDGSFKVLKRSSIVAYKEFSLVEHSTKYPIKSFLNNFIQDPFPIPEKGPTEGSKDDALYIIERYSSDSGYRWGIRTLYLTSRTSVVEMVKFLDWLAKMKWTS